MKINKNAVVTVDYVLRGDDGLVIDSSANHDGPLSYIHGIGALVPGLEAALEGMEKGGTISTRLEPADGYGEWKQELLAEVPRERFDGVTDLAVGMQFQMGTPNGHFTVTVTEISDSMVKVDGNHPLAGVALNFEVDVLDIREATAEELEHGHVHGPGGHES